MPTKEERDKFSKMIEERASKLSCTHMDAVIDYCSKDGMEIETAASLLNAHIKGKIEVEATDLRFLKEE